MRLAVVALLTVLATTVACVPTIAPSAHGEQGDTAQSIQLGRGGITLGSQAQIVPMGRDPVAGAAIGTAEIRVLPPRGRSGPSDERAPFATIYGEVLQGGQAGTWILGADTLRMELAGPAGFSFEIGDFAFDAIVTITFHDGREPVTARYRLSFERSE